MVGDYYHKFITVCMNCKERNLQLDKARRLQFYISTKRGLMAVSNRGVYAANIFAASFSLIDEFLDYNKLEDSYRTKHFLNHDKHDVCLREEWILNF